jgi:hypothetical protein
MSYRMVNGSAAARAPDAQGVLGYLYNNGGLNNQKMALVGLMLAGIREGVPINLPYIHNLDQRTKQEYVVRIEDIFDLDRILDFGRRHGLTIRTECPSGERGGWEHFEAFSLMLRTPFENRGQLDIFLDAVLSLQPRIAVDPTVLRMMEAVRVKADTAVQLRIEADWQPHAAFIRQKWGETEGSDLGYMGILSKVRNTFPDVRTIYATSDEKSMPVSKYEIRAVSRARFELDLVWKSDLLPAAVAQELTPLDLSIIDFEIAKISPRFIGLTTSTFTTMLTIEKLASTRRPVTGHYVYNSPKEVVVEREGSGFTPVDQIETLLAQGDPA